LKIALDDLCAVVIDDIQKPKDRRRRLFIVGVLLILAVTAWWRWPRGDARFVGKWAWSDSLPDSAPVLTMTLFRNGVGVSTQDGKSFSYPWYVDGSHLVMGHGSPGITTSFLRRLQGWLQGVIGSSPIVPAHAWEIVEVNEDEFLIRAFKNTSTNSLYTPPRMTRTR
jgi:hypothetical protein